MKNPKRTSAHKSSLQGYRDFTENLVYSTVYTKELDDDISSSDFAYR